MANNQNYTQNQNYNQTANSMNEFWRQFAPAATAIDPNRIFSMYRKNIEAWSDASRVMTEGLQTIGRRQAEISRSMFEQSLKNTREMMSFNSPETNAAKQAQAAKDLFEQSIENWQEVTDMASKSSTDAFKILQQQAVKNFEEISSKIAA